VADTGRGEVVAFGTEGASPSRLRPETNARFQPVAVAISGDRLYVADLETASIITFDIAGGGVATTITLSEKAGDAVMPTGVAVGTTEDVFVTDAMGGRVLVLSKTGELLRTISRRGDRLGDMGHPKHVDVAEDGTVFVSDAEFAHVHLYNENGQLLMLIGGPTDLAGGTPMPLGVAVIRESTALEQLVPDDFAADYFVVVTNALGSKRVSLFAVGMRR
jgi:DNA-binding beta-propeller fold protein YncE